MTVDKSVSQKLVKSLNLDQFSEELKANCTGLKLLVVELSVLQGLFDKRKEQILKSESGEESEQIPLALTCLRCSCSMAGLRVMFSFPLRFKFDE